MAVFPDTTPVTDFDLESIILEIYGASLVLTEIAESTLSGKNVERDEMDFRVLRLNDEQVKAFFYIAYAVHGHAHDLYHGFHAKAKAEAAATKKQKAA